LFDFCSAFPAFFGTRLRLESVGRIEGDRFCGAPMLMLVWAAMLMLAARSRRGCVPASF
jgi:hypothetical protein